MEDLVFGSFSITPHKTYNMIMYDKFVNTNSFTDLNLDISLKQKFEKE